MATRGPTAPGLSSIGLLAAAAACATTPPAALPRMSGFTARDATVVAAAPEPVDACAVRTGRLVVEIERVVIDEYPHHHADSAHAQQPLVVRYVGPASHPDVDFWVASPRYRPGDVVDELRALRILDRPLRALAGTRLTVRLAENDSTARPRWATRAEEASGATAAIGALGLPSPAIGLREGIEMVRKLDRDDLILEWSVDPADIARALAAAATTTTTATATARAVALRYHLVTARRAAAMDLVAYRDPEPGCP